MIDLTVLENESQEALKTSDEYYIYQFVHKWIPLVIKEIETLRQEKSMIELENTELRNSLEDG